MRFYFLILLLSACTTPPKKLTGPDGTPHILFTCADIEDCYQEARLTCGNYKIVNTNTHSYTANDSVHNEQKLLVKCEVTQK